MKLEVTENGILFPSGNYESPNRSFVGISFDSKEVSAGYDNIMYVAGSYKSITPEDRILLAEHMIERWMKFKAHAQEESQCDS